MFAIFIPGDARILCGFSYDCAGRYDTDVEAQAEADSYNRHFRDREAVVVAYSPELTAQRARWVADRYYDWLDGRFRIEADGLHIWPYQPGELPDEYDYS